MSEQARKVENKAIPDWAQGLYYNSGLIKLDFSHWAAQQTAWL